MAAGVANEDLEKGLKQARKSPRYFLLVGTGSKPLKLVVQKKPIKPAEIADAKKESKGTSAITGVCQGKGGTMTFLVTEEAGFKTVTLKDLIAEETGLTIKPEFEVVKELPEVKEDEEEGKEGEAAETAPQQDAAAKAPPAPPPPPAPPAPPSGLTAAQLTAALNKLTPAIQAAVVANPAKKAEILKPVAEFQAKIKANELDAAKDLLVLINRTVKELGSTAPPVVTPSTTESEGAATESEDAGAKPHVEAADKKAEAEYEKMHASLTDRYTEILRGQPSTATQIRGVMDFAIGKAENNDFTGGVTALKRLVALLDQAEEELKAEAIDAQVDAEDEGRGVVAFRKALLSWEAARNSAVSKLRSLQATVAKQYPDADVDRLNDIFDEVDESLNDALINCINAEDSGDRKHYNAVALDIIRDYKSTIDGSELVQGVDRNPFQENFGLGDSLKKALDQVATFLA